MKKINIEKIDECIYYDKLDNGLNSSIIEVDEDEQKLLDELKELL